MRVFDAPSIVVCFALPEEAGPFRRAAGNRPDVRIVVTGMGPINAERKLRAALKEQPASCVYTCGYAGGLNPALRFGEVVADLDGNFPHPLPRSGPKRGRFHCVNRVAATAEGKARLWRETGADAVEMESGVQRILCREMGIPSATVRVISDEAGEDMILDFGELTTANYTMNWPKLAGKLITQPSLIPRLMTFQKRLKEASENLNGVLLEMLGGAGKP